MLSICSLMLVSLEGLASGRVYNFPFSGTPSQHTPPLAWHLPLQHLSHSTPFTGGLLTPPLSLHSYTLHKVILIAFIISSFSTSVWIHKHYINFHCHPGYGFKMLFPHFLSLLIPITSLFLAYLPSPHFSSSHKLVSQIFCGHLPHKILN